MSVQRVPPAEAPRPGPRLRRCLQQAPPTSHSSASPYASSPPQYTSKSRPLTQGALGGPDSITESAGELLSDSPSQSGRPVLRTAATGPHVTDGHGQKQAAAAGLRKPPLFASLRLSPPLSASLRLSLSLHVSPCISLSQSFS